MKILCQSCAAKYTIADDKVVGKVIKIKCKKCSATIVVNGNDPATFAQGALEPAADEQATKLFTQQGGADEGALAANEWTVSVSDDDQRTLTTDQIIQGYQAGQIPGDAFVWRDGMTDWLPLVNVPELMALMNGGGAPQAAQQAAPAPQAFESTAALPAAAYGAPAYDAHGNGNGNGYGAINVTAPQPSPIHQTAPMAASAPTPAAAPAAARRAGGRGGGDLFGGGGGGGMAAATHAASQVGERNETSVLFSLGSLRAAEEQAARGDARPKPPVKGKQVSEARVDDIFSLDSGPSGPSLAPPPMMAPYIEPPPPPPPPQQVVAASQTAMGPASYPMGAAAFTPQEQPKKRGAGIIIGVLGLAAVGLTVGLILALTGKKDPAPVAANTTSTSEKTGSETKPSDTGSATDTKPSDTAKPDTTTPSSTDTATPDSTDTASPDDPKVASTDPTNPAANKLFEKKDEKKDEPKKDEPKKDEPKKDEPVKDDGKAGTAEFDRGAASAALSSRAGAAAGCKKEGGPTGSAKVSVTFAPSGGVTQATVGAPFAGTPTGSCIAGAFQGARVPAFSGSAMTVTKTVSIR